MGEFMNDAMPSRRSSPPQAQLNPGVVHADMGASLPDMSTTRRRFLATASAATLSAATHAFGASGDGRLKLALVGCGGRGTGAANQNLNTTKDVKLVAMADISRERLEKSLQTLKTQHGEQVEV